MQSTASQSQSQAAALSRPIMSVRKSIRRSFALAVIGCNMLCAFIIVAALMVQSTSALPVLFGDFDDTLLDRRLDQPLLLHHHGSLDSEEHCGEFDRVVSSSRGRFFAEIASNYNLAHMRRINAHRHSFRAAAKTTARVCKNVNEPRTPKVNGLLLTDGPQSLPHWTQPRPSMPFEEHALRLGALRETQVLYARPAAEWHDEL